MEVPTLLSRYSSSPSNHEQFKLPSAVRVSFLKKSNSNEELPNFGIPEFIIRNSILRSKCELCDQPQQKQGMDCISDCHHLFCDQCLQKYCIYKINVMEDVICPKQGCTTTINTNGTVYQRLPQITKDKYKRMLLWKQTISNPNLRLCPTENCEGVIDLSLGKFECNRCRVKFCKQCQLPQHSGPCDVNFQRNFKDWKPCPQCRMLIQKTEGCNHMTCRCGHQFCYHCLSNWSDQHYECGANNFPEIMRNVILYPLWKRILIGSLLLLGLPLFLVIMAAQIALMAGICTIGGFFCGPKFIISEFHFCQNILCLLFCPLMMIIGAVIGFFFGFIHGVYFAGEHITMYGRAVCTMLSFREEDPFQFAG